MDIKANHVLDAKGLACPMPIVKTKKTLNDLEPGQVIEVQATDKGSTADIQAWAKSTGEQYLGTVEEGDVLKHYLRKSDPEETKEPTKHPYVTSLEELKEKINGEEKMTILDVREPAEYAFGHIQGAKSTPLGDLDEHINDLHQEDDIHVICRTGNRSDFAAQRLSEQGFKNVKNVTPGMTEWDGPVEKHEGGNEDE
ncbi:sulfurtransferase TusA family protein [Halobacillus amylolyticus]|uniref:Sulfurtransferase TusA family protein n=1 Tax=Halobacillus amylolyticus TaxID=2932259 RepID=A0ABY4HDW0_9BACI|nr:sulfurtransferase TusA family protein [Halobacillus amylolyticus]UOR12090.1 sulfurtransferase TusA family protein [Halobacillus amylolyticus]